MPKFPKDSVLLIKDCAQDIIYHPELTDFFIIDIGRDFPNEPRIFSYPLMVPSAMRICMKMRN
jgi:hypothetical protein